MNEFEKIQTYFDICKASWEVYEWIYEINDYVVSEERIKELTSDDYTYQPLQIIDIQKDNLILIEPSDVDFYNVAEGTSLFTLLLNVKDMSKDEIQEKIAPKIISVDHASFTKNYRLKINFSNIIVELKKEKLLSNNTFFKLYEFLEYSSNYPQFSKDFSDAYSFYSLLILFFLDLKGFQYDFEKKKFVEKTSSQNDVKDFIL